MTGEAFVVVDEPSKELNSADLESAKGYFQP
jgi:hypothetical protein